MKILVIRFSSAGDILCTTPVLRLLRIRYPDAQITYLTKGVFAGLLESNRQIDRIIRYRSGSSLLDTLRLRREVVREGYDVIIDLHDSLRSRIIRYATGSQVITWKKDPLRRLRRHSADEGPGTPVPIRFIETCAPLELVDDGLGLELPVPSQSRGLSPSLPRPIIAVAPGAHHLTKRWPGTRFADALAELIVRTGGSGVLIGGAEDEPVAGEIMERMPRELLDRVVDLVGATDWQQTAGAIAGADVLIANDSVAGHIAAATGTPVISIFGSTSPVFGFAPFRVPGDVIEITNLECRPCTTTGRAECPLGHFRCMLDIGPSEVAERAMGLLRAGRSSRR